MQKTRWCWQIRAVGHMPHTAGFWTKHPAGKAGLDWRPATPAELVELTRPEWPGLTAFARRIDAAIEAAQS